MLRNYVQQFFCLLIRFFLFLCYLFYRTNSIAERIVGREGEVGLDKQGVVEQAGREVVFEPFAQLPGPRATRFDPVGEGLRQGGSGEHVLLISNGRYLIFNQTGFILQLDATVLTVSRHE